MRTLALVFAVLSASHQPAESAVYFDDFSSGSVNHSFNGYIGGWFGSNYNFNQWYGGSTNTSIQGGSLIVSSDFAYRSAVVLLTPESFTNGAGQYLITVNVTVTSASSSAVIPEPSSALLTCLSISALMLRRKR